jgi:hypothetical protein
LRPGRDHDADGYSLRSIHGAVGTFNCMRRLRAYLAHWEK